MGTDKREGEEAFTANSDERLAFMSGSIHVAGV